MLTAAGVRRAVVPAAGRGTRMLPATRAVPKELLPLGCTPVLDLVAAELTAAGIEEIVLVGAPGKVALEAHVSAWDIPVTVVHQRYPRGLGDAVLQAEAVVGDEPFAVALPDALLDPEVLESLGGALASGGWDGAVAVERVAVSRVGDYGIVDVDARGRMRRIVEKPVPEGAPSNLAVAARYVLPAVIFPVLRATPTGHGGELQLTDGIRMLLDRGARIAAVELPAGTRRRDVGSPAGYAAAFLEEVARASGVAADHATGGR